ncbi:MAG: winged helix-turn-helix domain-containing protein [Candidatus Bathyarchaeia archaeon]|jgi:DNA-binding transcriptional ArsR family regulator
MTVEFSNLHKTLKDPTRRDILRCLGEAGSLSYMDLMEQAKITNTGRLNYHLKILNGLIEKQVDGKYGLTEKGRLAVQLLDEFPEEKPRAKQQKSRMKKLTLAAILLLVGIIIVSSVLIITVQPKKEGFNVTYWKQQPDQLIPQSNYIQYVFNITGADNSFQLASSETLDSLLSPLVTKYPMATMTLNKSTFPAWSCGTLGNGKFIFALTLKISLSGAQLQSLTQDLKQALKTTQ